MLSASDLRRKFPQFAVHDDETAYYEYEAGFLRPERCIRAQLEMAKSDGAEIHINEKVVEITENNRRVIVRTDRSTYECDQSIVSAGAWLPQLIDGKHNSLFRATRQVLFWFDIKDHYELFTPPKFPVYIWETQGAQSMYGFPAVNGPDGGIKIASSAYMHNTSPDAVNRRVSAEEIATMYEVQIAPFFPQIGKECLKTSVCLYTRTPSSEFVIDRLKPDSRIIVCSPCSGHGFKHSAAIGEAVAQLATEGHSTICDISMLTFDRMLTHVHEDMSPSSTGKTFTEDFCRPTLASSLQDH
jgi:sarcosine oxidase